MTLRSPRPLRARPALTLRLTPAEIDRLCRLDERGGDAFADRRDRQATVEAVRLHAALGDWNLNRGTDQGQ